MTTCREIAKLSLFHVGSLFAATLAIITVIETINAVSMIRQAAREQP
jgi:hypothetical protein